MKSYQKEDGEGESFWPMARVAAAIPLADRWRAD
jgi:hypothetical protein